MVNLLKNNSFELDWGLQKSHDAMAIGKDGLISLRVIGNIFTPPDWLTWFRHVEGEYDQPEVRDAHKSIDPRRVQDGEKAMLFFTFQRRHWGGFLQRVEVEPGARLRLSGWAHAWSNHDLEGYEEVYDDPRWSCGWERDEAVAVMEVPPLGPPGEDPWKDGKGNFAFTLGIDPTGGTNPMSPSVIWGDVRHIYNHYDEVPPVETTALNATVTVFLCSKTLWKYKHNDAYWDNVRLETMYGCRYSPETPLAGEEVTIDGLSHEPVDAELNVVHESGNLVVVEFVSDEVASTGWHIRTWKTTPVEWQGRYTMKFIAGDTYLHDADFHIPDGVPAPEPPPPPPPPPPPDRGKPRVQYSRVYVLLPPGTGMEWAIAIAEARWDSNRWTIGGSADDAGIGDLNSRTVLAINPDEWGDDLEAFFAEYYPGVEYFPLAFDTPEDLITYFRGE